MSPPMNTRARVLLPAFLILLLALGYFRVWRERPDQPWRMVGKTMGTTFKVVVAPPQRGEESALRQAVQAELDELEALMSTYRSDSEVMRFNALSAGVPLELSAQTAEVVEAALKVTRETEGAFDVSVRPLVALWGFGAGAKIGKPLDADVDRVLDLVGSVRLQLDQRQLQKTLDGVEIDLSAIAKGYAVDRVLALLRGHGQEHVLVEVGGEVAVSGERTPGTPWRVGVEVPDEDGRKAGAVVGLRDAALATSGDYRNYYEQDGVRISHTVDPRSGRPIRHGLASVSVVHESAMMADAYATAINVLGPEAGRKFALAQGLAAYFIVRMGPGEFAPQSTPAFDKLLTTGQ